MGKQSTHWCTPANGVPLSDLNTRNKSYVTNDDGELFSGRIVYINDDDKFVEGYGSDPGDIPLMVHQGTDWAGVGGLAAIHDTLADNGMGQVAGGTIAAFPLLPGRQFITTEFVDTDSYSLNDPVQIVASDDGQLELASSFTENTTIGKVIKLGDETPAAYGAHGEDCLAIEIIEYGSHFLQA